MGFSKNRNPKSIKAIIEDAADHSAISSIALKRLMEDAWKLTVGSYIFKNTKVGKVINGKLLIHADSASIRSEIAMRQDTIITNINNELGKKIIKEISFF
jgi:predicted nucleic acid-binding Zn ribbon protein